MEIYSRQTDPTPVVCERCGWKGQQKDAIHTYQDDGTGEDVEPCDECPECGATDNFIEAALITPNHTCNQCQATQWFPSEYEGDKKCGCGGTFIVRK
jgi:hypothetical protein